MKGDILGRMFLSNEINWLGVFDLTFELTCKTSKQILPLFPPCEQLKLSECQFAQTCQDPMQLALNPRNQFSNIRNRGRLLQGSIYLLPSNPSSLSVLEVKA